ncbi:hypothetical protein Hanom_Chr15g01375431 [Helianthus anomalus]
MFIKVRNKKARVRFLRNVLSNLGKPVHNGLEECLLAEAWDRYDLGQVGETR